MQVPQTGRPSSHRFFLSRQVRQPALLRFRLAGAGLCPSVDVDPCPDVDPSVPFDARAVAIAAAEEVA